MSKLMIANWKSNKNSHEVSEWLNEIHKEYQTLVALDKTVYDVVICPPFPFIMQVGEWIKKSQFESSISLGVQDLSPFAAGSYTGAVSGQNLIDLNVKYAIVGHSERRKYFKESSLDVAKKVESCLEEHITPIVCVDSKEVSQQADVIDRKQYKQLVIAYEPVDHIGTGIAQELGEVLHEMKAIRDAFPGAQVIYGGSVNPENISQFSSQSEIEGFLVGSASLSPDKFAQMLKIGL